MNAGASFSGSFLPPGGGQSFQVNMPPIVNAPPQAPAPTVQPTPMPVAPAPTTGGITPEKMFQLINNLPSLLSGLSPEEQYKFLQFILTSDITNTMFRDLDRPQTKEAFKELVKTAYDSGLLSQVAPDTAVLPEEAQGLLKDALQQKIVQTLMQLNTNSPPKAANSAAAPPEGETQAPPTESRALNIPVSKQETAAPMTEAQATFVAKTVTESLQQVFTSPQQTSTGGQPQSQPTPTQQSANPAQAQAPQGQMVATPPAQAQNPVSAQAATLLSSLIALGLANTQEGSMQFVVPAKPNAQIPANQLTQELHLVHQQLSKLGDLAAEHKWNIGSLQNFISVPATLLANLKSVQPEDTMTQNLIKTWIDNSAIISDAILNRATETYKDKFELMKTIVFSSFTQAPPALLKEHQIRQQMFDQVLQQAPALLNVFKLKDMVAVFGDDIQRKHTALLYKFKRMLYNAAQEITIIAAGNPTFEYNEVGVFHDELAILAEKIKVFLPASCEELDFDLMEYIAKDITFTFSYIKGAEPRKASEILKRHPRTMLYLLATDSPVTQDIIFPRTESLGPVQDSTVLNMHFMRIMNVVKKFEKNSEFLKFQPKVFEAFIDEAKYDPTSEVTKTSLNIIHKAVAECSNLIDLDSPD